jgi:hypothetical protein
MAFVNQVVDSHGCYRGQETMLPLRPVRFIPKWGEAFGSWSRDLFPEVKTVSVSDGCGSFPVHNRCLGIIDFFVEGMTTQFDSHSVDPVVSPAFLTRGDVELKLSSLDSSV